MPGKKLHPFYVIIELLEKDKAGNFKRRTTRQKASNSLMALYNVLLTCKTKGINSIRSVTIESDPLSFPLVDKSDLYYYVTHSEGNHYIHKQSGERLSVEAYKDLPDKIFH